VRRVAAGVVLAVATVAPGALTGCTAPPPAPLVIAHRGGGADAPENTLEAIRTAVERGADLIWVSAQISADGVPVLYRPRDLGVLTNGTGPVDSKTADQLAALNAGEAFEDRDGHTPYRASPVGIPTLAEALANIPSTLSVIIDVKTASPEPMVAALFETINELDAWKRVVFYTTQADVHAALAEEPRAELFEARDDTRGRLVDLLMTGQCSPPERAAWIGYEVYRDLAVSEEYTLGQGHTEVAAQMWTEEALACVRRTPGTRVVFFGIADPGVLTALDRLVPDAILVDSLAVAAPT
jgi:glycerophosphoryl diester phosphodiesterase